VENLRYPLKTIVGLSLAAALSLYGILEFYGEQSERNRTASDPYQLAAQQERFEPLNRELAPNLSLGYVSDLKPEAAVVLGVQYSIAPRLLVVDAPHQLTLGNFSRPQDYAEVGRARGLSLVKEFPNGVVLYRKTGP
jgi:hypothetical protein